jgi:hypothetical protein
VLFRQGFLFGAPLVRLVNLPSALVQTLLYLGHLLPSLHGDFLLAGSLALANQPVRTQKKQTRAPGKLLPGLLHSSCQE